METIEKSPELLTIGEIVATNYRTADIFDKYGIDFCCGGKRLLADVCTQKGIHFESVLQEVNQLGDSNMPIPMQAYQHWPLDFLIEYIVQTHHQYLQEELPQLAAYLHKLVQVHGSRHPELAQVESLFVSLKNELLSHLWKEENILFPYIKKIVALQKENGKLNCMFAANPILVMEAEHETAGDLLKEIRQTTQNFTLPEDACTTYRVTFDKLKALEKDLHTHVHLENNILFPKSMMLENQLLNQPQSRDEYVI
ncbi:iron-sulfur cluster repair di-iron protein [Cytophagaceae bacterium DM2B3-1]|uniref:Iron-sulfur cluster repair di-iron protein n=1 Tax=Xanthocytophaga flava TaxID=3048013 RepID=A0ABT7CHL8_9BACT|nr:iron-sulfur cluster repair di-iron protein [Xanthocytophaga flavus]MDJ1472329.1 iron-sulfur cluster repair di-iron protein [Xanthocytophaga flavus]MDJ1493026.1 iron-sulfur cluster repair di-iron protein [Xanthocytophaga flavus]